jgi:hypothetical protein
MKQNHRGLDIVVDLEALQKRAAVEGIYNHVPDEITEARHAMLYAMERHDADRIRELIRDMDEKINELSGKAVAVGYYMSRKQLVPASADAYRHIINIGRVALLGLCPDEPGALPAEPLKRWDA